MSIHRKVFHIIIPTYNVISPIIIIRDLIFCRILVITSGLPNLIFEFSDC